jgi:hypothetical protein
MPSASGLTKPTHAVPMLNGREAPNLYAYRFFVVNRKGTLTHAATGFDSGVSV